MDMKETIIDAAKSITDTCNSILDETVKLANKTADKHICIGVTGFSGSGKSTFITSLIHQLRYSNEASLGGFHPARDQKIIETNVLPIHGLELFDYEGGIKALASNPPKWPNPTSSLSGCVIEVVYKRDSFIKSVIGEETKLRVEIRDYPGEWLLDIPLIGQDYLSWCIDSAENFNQGERKKIMGDWLHSLESISPFTVLKESEINTLYEQYSVLLKQCKEQGMTLIQPGHVLLPGESDFFAPFFPLIGLRSYSAKALKKADSDSVFKVMEKRYNDYVKNTVKPFFNDYFNHVDRQVILIDTLKALSGGEDNFEDMMTSFSRIIDCYKFGENGVFKRTFSPDVERILFLSSKPDRVLMNQHENLRQLTESIIQRVCKQSVRNTIKIETEIACAVRCTEDKNTHLTGVSLDGQKGNISHPDIPEHIPVDDEWDKFNDWKPFDLQPPLNEGLKHGARLPCIRMDTVLKDLIGDKF